MSSPKWTEIRTGCLVFLHLGELLPINGVIYKKKADQPTWYLLCSVSGGSATGIYVMANKYLNQPPTHISFSLVGYSGTSTIKVKFNIRANNDYEASFKYKKEKETIKLWCNAGDILAIFSRTPSAVLVEQEPDGDAIDINGDI